MLPPDIKTAHEAKNHYEAVYGELIATGKYVPFLYPWATLGFSVVLIYLLIDHRRSPTLQALRFPLYGFLCAFSTWCVTTNKARSPAAGYGVGLCSAWGTLWTGAIMFFNDCQTDFQRIERADEQAVKKVSSKANDASNRSIPNGSAKSIQLHNLDAAERIATEGPSQRRGPLFWQSYPTQPFIERLDWMLDVFSNFRGVNWSFQTSGIPPPPRHIQVELDGAEHGSTQKQEISTSKTGIQRFSDRQALLRHVLIRLVVGALALDIVKTLMQHDAYFWGRTDAAAPPWLPHDLRASPMLVRSYRLLLSLSGISIALLEVFRLGPVFFSGVLGPGRIGVRGEAWSNPADFYGAFGAAVLDHGLAGWWGTWWHQIFRFGFEAPSARLLEWCGVDRRSARGRALGLCVAFFLSGCLHACGSYTQLGDTRPLMGPFRFFALQPLGILCQMAAARGLTQMGITERMPRVVRQLANFVVVHVWLYHTAPLLADDFAKGGIWLYEPLAFSPLRMLGFGPKDDSGWNLWYGLIFWRQGEHWWDTGLAF